MKQNKPLYASAVIGLLATCLAMSVTETYAGICQKCKYGTKVVKTSCPSACTNPVICYQATITDYTCETELWKRCDIAGSSGMYSSEQGQCAQTGSGCVCSMYGSGIFTNLPWPDEVCVTSNML